MPKSKLTEAKAETAALAAAKATGKFVRCYVFRLGTRPGSGWDWCLDMSKKYIEVRKGGVCDLRTLREVPQDSAPY